MTDSNVQVAPDGGGKRVDTSQLVQDGSTVVQRQRVALGDATAVDNLAAVDSSGNLLTRTGPGTAKLSAAVVNQTGTSGTLVSAGSGKTTKLHRMLFTSTVQTEVTIMDGTTALSGPMRVGANGALALDFSGEPWFTGSTNTDLILKSSTAGTLGGVAHYVQN